MSSHADRRPALLARNRLKAEIRTLFEADGFTEVDPTALVVSPGAEIHLHAFSIAPRAGTRGYLHTSPEFAMKTLLAAGETAIFALSPVYRAGEDGSPLHAASFTMLEWYRANAPYEALFEDCAAVLRLCEGPLRWRGRTCDPAASPERLSVAEAFRRYADIEILATVRDDGTGDRDALAQSLPSGVRIGPDDTWSDLFARVLVERVEPHLGAGRPTFLHDYPAPEAALARLSPADPRVAERFEAYACGVELANGYGELTDPVEQRRRIEADMAEKVRRYGIRYPVDEDFLAALSSMPPASGCALGFDRLVMLATGAPRVQDVMWTPG